MNSFNKKHIWARFCSWVVNHRKLLIIVGSIVTLLTAAALTYFFVFYKPASTQPTPETQLPRVVDPPKYYSPLTGKLVESDALTKRPVSGVMIENSPEARPQSGLADAGVVFEAICEGGITRFLAIYQSERPQLVGPVRSVRMYYIDWAAGFNASIAHVGGNIDALNEIRNGIHRDLDQFSNGGSYWRSDDRYAPHNMYTSFDNIDAMNTAKGYTSSSFTAFPRIDGAPSAAPTASVVNVTISGPLFDSSYTYDAATNKYARSQAGATHTDSTGVQITPSVVIAMYVNEYTGASAEGSQEYIATISSGRAVVFQNGIATEATWSKSSQSGQIQFIDTAGLPISLIRGQTWITAIPNGNGNVLWQ